MPGELPADETPWIWQGRVDKDGYGQLTHENVVWAAHRAAYTIFVGLIPAGLMIRHKNDTPLDVNPLNLELGTHADNQQDKMERGRQPLGSAHGQSKLTEDSVREARELYATGNYTQLELARFYGIDDSTMCVLLQRKTWKHVA
ncbi:HNH endonuclease [Nocardia jiangxiensis]|uniref:HNH endonuclease n=1 Tax=Nocardia jiangxiensis TaxID=282685 RepID=UPI0012F62759|nr:HNH endonuclease [Nocardia jiangxiensis]